MDTTNAATTTTDRLIRLPEVMRRTGMSRSWVYDAVKGSRFPAPLQVGGRAIAWRELDVMRWLEQLAPVPRPQPSTVPSPE